MVRCLLQLHSNQINWFDSSIGSTCQVGYCDSGSAFLQTPLYYMRWIQFINHANYKIIDSNVMDWANVRKIHTPPSAKRYFPPWWACAVQTQFRDRKYFLAPRGRAPFRTTDQRSRGPGMGELSKARDFFESHCWHPTAWWKRVVPVSLTQNIKCLRFALPACNKCSVFKQNEDVEG